MSANLNYSKLLGKHPKDEVVTPDLMALLRNPAYLTLPCVPLHETYLDPETANFGAFKPNSGAQHGSRWGLGRTPEHPTDLPFLPNVDPFDKSKVIKFSK